jgi:hypothetical protein
MGRQPGDSFHFFRILMKLPLLASLSLLAFDGGKMMAASAANADEAKPRIYKVTEVDQKPEVIRSELPKEPKRLLGADAAVAVLVDVDGVVIQVQLAKASDKEYGQNAIEAAQNISSNRP